MLARLLSAIAGTGADRAGESTRPAQPQTKATKAPARPPSPRNDEGMRRVCEEVEKALREAGHLR